MKRFVLVCTCLTLAFAGCGDDDEGDSGGDVVSAPEAETSLEEHISAVNEAIAQSDCEAIMEQTFSFTRAGEGGLPAEPGDPVRPEECSGKAPAVTALQQLQGTEFTDSEEGGPAAVIDGSGGKPVEGYERWTMISLIDRDGHWRHVVSFPADPQTEEDPPDDADHAEMLDLALAAVRSGDCKSATEAFNPDSPLSGGKGPEVACENLAGGQIFGPALKATEEADAEPEELVVARDFVIYGIPTEETYFAAVMATPPGPPNQPPQSHFFLTDLLPLTDFELPEAEQKETGGGTETGPAEEAPPQTGTGGA